MIHFAPIVVFILFFLWGVFSFLKAVARERRYRKYQRDHWLLADAIEHGFMALALLGSAMRNGTHPADFTQSPNFRNLIILAWLVAFIPLIVGQILDWRSLGKIEMERNKSA